MMKHLKIFENIDGEQMIKKSIEEHNKMCDMIKDYLNFEDPNLNVKNVIHFYYERDLEKVGDIGLIVSYNNQNYENEGVVINENDFKKLYRFVENPDYYKNIKKYNL